MKPRKFAPFRSHSCITTIFSIALLAHFAAPSASALTYYWDNDGATAGFGAAVGTWAVPTTGDATQGFSESATGATLPVNVTTTTADTVNFGNGATGLATGSIAVSGTVDAGTVNFASGSGPITLSGGTISLGGSRTITAQNDGNTIGSAIALDGNGTISFGRPSNSLGTLTLNGGISGTGNLTFTTPNVNSVNVVQTIVLGAANNYTGNTTITTANSGTTTSIKCGVNDALPTTTVLTLNGGAGSGSARTVTFDLNGKNQTLAGLSNVTSVTARNQTVTNTGALATLTVNNTDDYSFGRAATHVFSTVTYTTRARIQGDISLVKSGVGKFTLVESHTYTGATTINGGKLIGVVGGSQTSDVTLNNAAATYGVSITDNTKKWTCKSLATTAAGTLEFNFGAVAPSSSVSPLTVTNAADFSTTPLVSVVFSASLAPGTYPLMTWGSTSGTAPTTANLTVSQLPFGSTAELQVSGNTLNLVVTSNITYAVKANNTDNLNLGSSWVGGTAPTVGDIAKWNSTVTSANSTVLGADLTWPGMVIENPTGLVTIGGGNTLTLGAADIDIDLSSADTANLSLNCPLTLGAANVWDVASGRTLTVGGGVSGNFPLTMQGSGAVRLGAGDVLPNGTGNGNVTVGSTLDLNGFSDTLNGLSGAGTVDNAAATTTSTLTVGGNDQSGTFSGVLQNSGSSATLQLTKIGTGSQTLSGANTHTGSTSITGGTLKLGNLSALGGTTGITMAGGTTLVPTISSSNPANAIDISVPITVGATGTTATITAPDVAGSGTTNFPVTISGAISGDGDVTFSGVSATNAYGVINLNAACDYAGSTLITTISGYGGGPPDNTMIFMKLGVENALPVTTVVTLDGGNGGGTGWGRYCEFDLNGNDQTVAGLTNISGRTLRVQRVVNSGAAKTLTVNNTNDYVYSGQFGWISGQYPTTGSGPNYNNFGVTKSGSGSMTFAGTGNYTGATTVSGGKLFINGNQTGASGAVAVSGGATLGGTGTIGGDTTIADTGKLEFNFSTDAAGHDKLDLAASKTLAFAGASVLTITSTSGAATGTYTLLTTPGGITGSVPATVVLPAGWTADPPAITGVGNTDLVINITSIGGGGDVTPPTLTSITDNQSGGPVGINTVITYTVTFSEDIDSSTVSAADFDNNGTAPITIGSITETSPTSGVFTVQVTPTSSGTLNLRLPGGVVVKDVAGNSLVVPVSDDTTIIVQTPYESWASGALFNADANGDGVKNGLAWILGATNPNTSALDKLPTTSTSGGNMTLNFKRTQASINANTALSIEVGTTLASWPTVYTVGADTAGSTAGVTVTKDAPVAGTDTVILTVTQSPDAKKFARVKAVQIP